MNIHNILWVRNVLIGIQFETVAYAGKNFGGVQGYGRPLRESGGLSPPDAEKFSKICKKCLKKIAKNALFLHFSKNLANHALIFRAFRRKLEIVGKF